EKRDACDPFAAEQGQQGRFGSKGQTDADRKADEAAHLRRLLESAHEGRTVVAQSGKGAEGHLIYGRRDQGANQLDHAPCDAEMPQDDGAEEGADKKIECLLADTADHLAGRDMEAETRGFAQIRQREAEARPPADSREDRDVGDDGGDELLSDEAPGAEIED